MAAIIFEGTGPFELVLQSLPTTSAEAETVVVTLPVFSAGQPQQTARVRLRLSIDQAQQIFSQLDPALRLARMSAKLGR